MIDTVSIVLFRMGCIGDVFVTVEAAAPLMAIEHGQGGVTFGDRIFHSDDGRLHGRTIKQCERFVNPPATCLT